MTLSLLERAQIALAETGWRSVTTFPEGFEPREFSLVYDGGLYYLFSTHPADSGTVVYSAATLEGLGDAAPTVVSASSLWYPNAVKMDKTWYVFGTTGAAQVGFITASNPSGPWSSITTLRSGFFNIDLNDPAVTLTTINGTPTWLLTGITTTPDTNGRLIMRVYRHTDPPTATGWVLLEEGEDNVLRDVGIPDWADVSNYDPNLCVIDGRYYVLFDGQAHSLLRSNGVVELDIQGIPPTSAYATGTVLQLSTQENGGTYWFDPQFLSCPDGIDRLFGTSDNFLACLDLPGDEGSVAVSDAAVGSVTLGDAQRGAAALLNAAVGSVVVSDRTV